MKNKNKTISLQRTQLDQKLKNLRRLLPDSPRSGWINAIRTSIGMSARQLAQRLNVSRQAIASYENEEQAGAITLSTLTKVAEALGCKVLVTLVPSKPLELMIKAQALSAAQEIIERTELHMKMEQQGTSSSFRKRQIKELAEELTRTLDRRLWDPKP